MKTFTELIDFLRREVHRPGFSTAEQITHEYCPYAHGLNNGGMIVPNLEILVGDPGVSAWCDMMTFFNVEAINYWLKTSEYFKENLIQEMMHAIPRSCMIHELPYVLYTPIPECVSVRKGTLLDVIAEYNMVYVEDLRVYLFMIVIMGIFTNDYMAEQVFRIQNKEKFIAARLFQGEVDHRLNNSRLMPMPGGVFMDQVSGDDYTSLPFFNSVNGPLTQEEFSQLVAREKIKVSTSRFIGNEAPQVVALKNALELSDNYTAYLERRDDRFAKVGSRAFENIVLGSSTRKEIMYQDQSKREITMPYGIKPQGPKATEQWTSAMTKSLFDPIYGTPIYNFRAPVATNPGGSAHSAQVDPTLFSF